MRAKPFKKQFSLQTHATLKANINKTLIMLKLSAECTGKCKRNFLIHMKLTH